MKMNWVFRLVCAVKVSSLSQISLGNLMDQLSGFVASDLSGLHKGANR